MVRTPSSSPLRVTGGIRPRPRADEVVMRHLATSIFQQLQESEFGIGKTALQYARAHTQFPRSVLDCRTPTGQ